jgi:hypothetical protein
MDIPLTLILAIWGALLSTVLAVVRILDFRKDRADIVVKVNGRYKFYPQNTAYGDKSYIIITAANKGRRPVTLRTAFMPVPRNIKKKQNISAYICADPNTAKPIELTEGKYHQYYVLENEIGIPETKYVAGVADATGRLYYSHNYIKRLWKLKRFKHNK